jgi:predicted DNA-binding antitoxin AbrB/MazE fold protein
MEKPSEEGQRPPKPRRKTMTRNLQAIYEKGVLRPLEPLDLREHQLVTVAITDEAPAEPWLDTECLADCAAGVDDNVTLEQVRAALATIPGSLTEDFIAEREDR